MSNDQLMCQAITKKDTFRFKSRVPKPAPIKVPVEYNITPAATQKMGLSLRRVVTSLDAALIMRSDKENRNSLDTSAISEFVWFGMSKNTLSVIQTTTKSMKDPTKIFLYLLVRVDKK